MKKLIILVPLLICGCSSYNLPQVQGQNVVYHRTDPFGGTTIEAKGVNVTETYVSAEHASWNTTYPTWSVQLSVDGFKQKRDKPDAKIPQDSK